MARPYPFSALVGQDSMKTALLLNAVDPGIGGVLIRGHQGTGKSTAARALAGLLPEIEVVSNCPYHCPPRELEAACDLCRARWAAGEALPRAKAPTPVITLPLGATEDRLVGTLHLEHALRSGERRFDPGLLAAAHRGVLYVDEVNLLDDHLVDLLLDVAASGTNVVEREGISFSHPSRFILVGSMNPEEGELRPQFLDRYPLCVAVEGLGTEGERREVLQRRLAFEADKSAFRDRFASAEAGRASQIRRARAMLERVSVPEETIDAAVRLALEVGARGHRADIVAVKAARALAALQGRERTTASDVAAVARLVLLHRLPNAPLDTPAALLECIDAAAALIRGEPKPSTMTATLELDLDAEAEAMQVPGSSAAGSISFEPKKKSP